MARLGETCGVVTGAMMVIGLKHGKIKAADDEAKEKTYQLVLEFIDKFKSYNNTIMCRELLNCDMTTPEGLQEFKKRNLIETHCIRFVKDSANILEEILNSPKP